MLDSLKEQYIKLKQTIAVYVKRAETELAGMSGSQKRQWVITQLDAALKLNPLWDDVLKVDDVIIGYLVDKICDTWNILADGDIRGLGSPDSIAAVADAKLADMIAAKVQLPLEGNAGDTVTVEDRISMLLKEYGISKEEVSSEPAKEVPSVSNANMAQDTAEERWAKCLSLVFGSEGGKSNHSADKGGPTNMGITAGTLATAVSLGIVKTSNVNALTREEASRIYHELYWKKCAADQMLWHVCYLAFDTTVNGGLGMWASCVQRAMNKCFGSGLVIDGKIGPKTQGAVLGVFGTTKRPTAFQMNSFATQFLLERKAYYDRIIDRDASQAVFKNGWYNRLRNIAGHIKVTLPEGL